jgi:hypothetical protein
MQSGAPAPPPLPVKRKYVRPKCSHGTPKGYCKIEGCFGSQLCKHKKTRSRCADKSCGGGSSMCKHEIRRNLCADEACGGGSSLCVHLKPRTLCAVASCNGGGSLCAHKISRSFCSAEECKGGGSLCTHKKPRALCKEEECHGGTSLCEKHKRTRTHCPECTTMQERLNTVRFCVVCADKRVSLNRRRDGLRTCAECDPTVPRRTELVIRPLLVERVGRATTIADDAWLGGAGCDVTKRRPDLLFLSASEYPKMISKQLVLVDGCAVFIEIDEDSHEHRLSACEAAKLCDEMTAIQKLCGDQTRCIFLRLNPDAYDKERVSLEDRIAFVGDVAHNLLEGGWRDPVFANPAVPHVSFFFYHSKGQHHIDHIRANPDAFHMFSARAATVKRARLEN